MAASRDQRKRNSGGTIDDLPSGPRRVRVHAGTDPVTKKKHRLVENAAERVLMPKVV